MVGLSSIYRTPKPVLIPSGAWLLRFTEGSQNQTWRTGKWRLEEVIVMVDFAITQTPGGRLAPESLNKNVNVLSFDPNATVDAGLIEQLKSLLSSGSVRQTRKFLLSSFSELKDLTQFNLLLVSANSGEEKNVNMDIILKTTTEMPVVRLSDSKGEFCVVRFDR